MYYVNDKQFKDKCTAREYSWQLCYNFSKHEKHWKIVTLKSTTDSMLDSYAVYDIVNKEYVYDAVIITEGA